MPFITPPVSQSPLSRLFITPILELLSIFHAYYLGVFLLRRRRQLKRTQREKKTLESLERRIGELYELIEPEHSTEDFVRSLPNPNTVRKTNAKNSGY